MRAIVQKEYGSSESLELGEVPRPEPGEHDALIRVYAASVDRGAWHLMVGRPYVMRAMGFGLRAPKIAVPGSNFAGVVESVGAGVTKYRPGDEVYGMSRGAFAELVVAPEEKLAVKPTTISFEEAAVVPHGGLAALQAVNEHAEVEVGQAVLVIGASGSVGSFVVQLAKARGAVVTAVCSTSKIDVVRSLGADHVIDYTKVDPLAVEARDDVIIDIAGNHPLRRLRKSLTPDGTLVIVGGEDGGQLTGGTHRQLAALALSSFTRQTLRSFIAKERGEDLEALTQLIEGGVVAPVLDRTFPLGEAAEAVRYFETGRAPGRIALTP